MRCSDACHCFHRAPEKHVTPTPAPVMTQVLKPRNDIWTQQGIRHQRWTRTLPRPHKTHPLFGSMNRCYICSKHRPPQKKHCTLKFEVVSRENKWTKVKNKKEMCPVREKKPVSIWPFIFCRHEARGNLQKERNTFQGVTSSPAVQSKWVSQPRLLSPANKMRSHAKGSRPIFQVETHKNQCRNGRKKFSCNLVKTAGKMFLEKKTTEEISILWGSEKNLIQHGILQKKYTHTRTHAHTHTRAHTHSKETKQTRRKICSFECLC